MDGSLRFDYHFEPKKGWMNDPNGLIRYKGMYHAFFQHNPYSAQWGPMHWGHAVSRDLLHWEELPIALRPDMPYENFGGCFSGSAVEKDGRLYLIYTSVSKELAQTQSVAWSDDGVHFTKYEGNPVIRKNPFGTPDFRDPKVTLIDGKYYMAVGTGDKTVGKVLLFTSDTLLDWEYAGVLFEGAEYANCIECPDFFKLGDRYVLMFSKIGTQERSTHFVVGDFEDGRLVNYTVCRPEWGPDFYAPQTFADGERRLMIGWMYHWGKQAPKGYEFAGALSIPRVLTLDGGRIKSFPAEEARHLLTKESEYVEVSGNTLTLKTADGEKTVRELERIDMLDILEDTKSVEVFVNGGEAVYSFWKY